MYQLLNQNQIYDLLHYELISKQSLVTWLTFSSKHPKVILVLM